MLKAAKLLITDPDEKYLLMYRSDHPIFGSDPDLPGGTVEDDESFLDATVREVMEEAGITVDPNNLTELYSGVGYSRHGTHYVLYAVAYQERPEISMSWEHSSYEWLDRDEFVRRAKAANDSYMHMVGDVIEAMKNQHTV